MSYTVNKVIDRQGTGTYTVTRTPALTRTKGRLDTPTTSTLSIDAVVLPVSGRDLQLLPEGSTYFSTRAVWTRTLLRVAPEPDRISIGGETYEVRAVFDRNTEASYYKALVSLV